MNRYIAANDTIHPPGHLVRNVCKTKKHRPVWLGAAAATTALAIFAAIFLWPALAQNTDPQNNYPLVSVAHAAEVLAQPTYPTMNQAPNFDGIWSEEKYEKWMETRRIQWQQRPEDDSALDDFYAETAREFLLNTDGKNALYSPLNLYITLGMLAEVTDGNTRAQILDLLNVDTVEELRDFISALWNVNYSDDGTVVSLLASSLWLLNDTEYNMDTLNILADNYYASSHRGIMGSDKYNKMFRKWLNDHTGGMISGQVEQQGMEADTVLALASTIYYQAMWETKFQISDTAPDIFHAPKGDLTVDFLNRTEDQEYYWDEDFAAVELPLAESGSMWLFLPDEDKTIADLLDGSALKLIQNPREWENRTYIQVELSVPKFDVTGLPDLYSGLQNLGVTEVFEWGKADFSPLCENHEQIYLSDASHCARVMIDEEGCTGAAFSVLPMEYAAIPPEEIAVFKADRPFLFAVTGRDNQILFLGVVNQP